MHALYGAGGAAVDPIRAAFPSAVIDGAVSRPALGACVLGNDAAMRHLESIVHPLVSAERRFFLAAAVADGHPIVVFDIPLLYETVAESTVDAVLVVSAPQEVQKERVLARPGMSADKLAAILGRQLPDDDKRKRADFVIRTDVTIEETRAQVAALLSALKGRTGSAHASHQQ